MKKKEIWIDRETTKKFEEKIVECITQCQLHYHHEILPIPKLIFKNIGGSAGRCTYDSLRKNSVVIINPAYFQKEGGFDEQLINTLPHEVAHHVCYYIYRNKRECVRGHGLEWAQIMRWLGRRPERCHNMDTRGIVNKHERPYSYKCGCNINHFLTTRMHVSIQRDGKNRRCKNCKQRLVFQGVSVERSFLPMVNPPKVIPAETIIKSSSTTPNPPVVPDSKFRVMTKFINGSLQNVRIPIED